MAFDDVLHPGAVQPAMEKNGTADLVSDTPVEATDKTWWQRRAPVIACGSGLFSDGYLNGVIGSVNTILRRLYKTEYATSNAQSNITSLVFVGEVVGIIIFGYTSDRFSRKWSIFASTIIVVRTIGIDFNGCRLTCAPVPLRRPGCWVLWCRWYRSRSAFCSCRVSFPPRYRYRW